MADSKTSKPKTKRWLVKNGIDYPSTRTGEYVRAEIGDEIDDIPPKSQGWLRQDGHIEEIDSEEEN